MEVRNAAAWSHNLLETYVPAEPILACLRTWLQPQRWP